MSRPRNSIHELSRENLADIFLHHNGNNIGADNLTYDISSRIAEGNDLRSSKNYVTTYMFENYGLVCRLFLNIAVSLMKQNSGLINPYYELLEKFRIVMFYSNMSNLGRKIKML